MSTGEQPTMTVVRDSLVHYVEESLRTGASKEDVRRTLDMRIVTVINEKAAAGASSAELQEALDLYVTTVDVLTETEVEVIDFSEPEQVTA